MDITADMQPDILSISYTDNEDGQVDDIAITLKNDDGIGHLKKDLLFVLSLSRSIR